jgi:hypothetical protein
MGYYNWRVFRDPFTPPYRVNYLQYVPTAQFVWQTPRPVPAYRHRIFHDFYVSMQLAEAREARTPAGFLKATVKKAGVAGFFFYGMMLAPALVVLPRALRARRMRFPTGAAACFAFGVALNHWMFPHYASPGTALFYAFLIQCFRHLRAAGAAGAFLSRALPAGCVLLAVLRVFSQPLGIAAPRSPAMWYGTDPLGLRRAAVLSRLEALPGPQLAIVRYGCGHNALDDWVYNAADIDRSMVVWARDMGAGENRALMRYFAGRTAWLVEPDADPPRTAVLAQDRPKGLPAAPGSKTGDRLQ